MTFVSDYLSNKTEIESIDDYIEDWHNGLNGKDVELREYLGFNKEEYGIFLTDPDELYKRLYERKYK